jgi:hypothetical protein
MQTIWKAVLRVADVQPIVVPVGAEMLFAREQFEEICIWFRCDSDAPKEQRLIAVIATGAPAPGNEARYLGSASLMGGNLIYHVFERKEAA